MLRSFLEAKPFAAMAHRGGNPKAENSIKSFERAIGLGYLYIETDVRATKDGVVVVLHDASLERVAGDNRQISNMTWAELLDEVVLSDGSGIPRLSDVLERFPDTYFNIDPKSNDVVEPLIEVIVRTQSIDRVCVASFSARRVQKVRLGIGPALCTAPGGFAIVSTVLLAAIYPNRNSPYTCLQIPLLIRTNRLASWLVRRLQASGLAVHVWTINSQVGIEQALALGVDGIISDEIELLKAELKRCDKW